MPQSPGRRRGHRALQRTTKILQEKAGVWSGYLGTTLRAVQDFSVERVEAVYNEASSLYPVDMVTERLIEPVRARLGNDWQLRDAGIAEEHFYSHWVRNRLGARFHHASSQASGARILCACLPGSRHEIGLMLFTISALTRGYRVLYIGADLPLAEIPAVVSRSGTRGVVLSSRAGIDGAVEQQLADLAACVNAPVLLGGPCSDQPLRRFEQVPQRGQIYCPKGDRFICLSSPSAGHPSRLARQCTAPTRKMRSIAAPALRHLRCCRTDRRGVCRHRVGCPVFPPVGDQGSTLVHRLVEAGDVMLLLWLNVTAQPVMPKENRRCIFGVT